MYNRMLLQKVSNGPLYVYCDIQDVALRIAVIDGEVEVFAKYRDKREFKTVYDSKLVGLALSGKPLAITKEQYDNFTTIEGNKWSDFLRFVCLFFYPALDLEPFLLTFS
jgi:hypothetical protein